MQKGKGVLQIKRQKKNERRVRPVDDRGGGVRNENIGKTLDKISALLYNGKTNGEVPKWLKGLPC